MTAGNRAIWFDRAHRDATYIDIRPGVSPDIIADSRQLPEEVGEGFGLIVFDPPHENYGAAGRMSHNYGHHTRAEIRNIIERSSKEAYRVSTPDALMAFKWNDTAMKLAAALALMPDWEPLFGHGVSHQQRRSSTSWVMLRKKQLTAYQRPEGER